MYVSEKYQQLLAHIADIAKASGRNPSEIALIAVSKGHPWPHIEPAYAAGCRQFGESRLQEALPKMCEAPADVQWHFIGPLQKNKVRKVVESFALIHSVDSLELAEKISECSVELGIVTSILLEVNTSGERSKHGLSEAAWESSLPALLSLPALRIEGLMTMAPLVEDVKVIRHCFSQLRAMRDRLQMTHLSMGMSHDYPIAIEEGATLLRIGSAIFS